MLSSADTDRSLHQLGASRIQGGHLNYAVDNGTANAYASFRWSRHHYHFLMLLARSDYQDF